MNSPPSSFILRIPLDNNSTESRESPLPIKRSVRHRTKPKKYGDFVEQSPAKHKAVRDISTSEDDEVNDNELSSPQKPTALFTEDDVEGQDMFQFKSRHTKHDIHNKVKTAIASSPRLMDSPKTPRRISSMLNSPFNKTNDATPRHVKDIIKKRIIKEVESDSEGTDFSGSSSDFVPDDSDNETESSSGNASEAEEEDTRITKIQIVKNRQNKLKNKDSEYIVTPDNYFMMNSTKKITTSDHTLSRLKNMNLNDIKGDIEISKEHKDKIIELNTSYHHLFNKWLYVLSENFNIILYGIGSKRSILHQFQMEKLKKIPCIVINGFFPSLTMKSILEAILVDLLENTHVPSNIGDIVNIIDMQLSESGMDLFLIVHNIDGTMLRNAKAQSMLASLSQIRNVHTIATIDHINAPLLWDHSKLSKFRFTWWDVTTFMPYTEETSYENSLMSQRGGALQLSSLRSVYQSLTSNAKGIFNIIIQYQMENYKAAHYQGLPFKDLYSKSREQFLVSSDTALRAQLTEFLDHKLVKMKRTQDGSENLIIPMENSLLQQFLDQQNS